MLRPGGCTIFQLAPIFCALPTNGLTTVSPAHMERMPCQPRNPTGSSIRTPFAPCSGHENCRSQGLIFQACLYYNHIRIVDYSGRFICTSISLSECAISFSMRGE